MSFVLKGRLRFVDRRGARAALRVDDGNAAGRRFLGRTVTLDLAGAQVSVADRDADGTISHSDLVAGDQVVVTLRLSRHLAEPPELLPVRRLTALQDAVGS